MNEARGLDTRRRDVYLAHLAISALEAQQAQNNLAPFSHGEASVAGVLPPSGRVKGRERRGVKKIFGPPSNFGKRFDEYRTPRVVQAHTQAEARDKTVLKARRAGN